MTRVSDINSIINRGICGVAFLMMMWRWMALCGTKGDFFIPDWKIVMLAATLMRYEVQALGDLVAKLRSK